MKTKWNHDGYRIMQVGNYNILREENESYPGVVRLTGIHRVTNAEWKRYEVQSGPGVKAQQFRTLRAALRAVAMKLLARAAEVEAQR